jgi:hypothetical protein
MSRERLLEIRNILSKALSLIDELLNEEYRIEEKESKIPKFELKEEEKEIEEINWIKMGNWEYTHIYNFPPSFIKEIREKGYITKNGYLYKLKRNKYGMKVIRKKIVEKFDK